MAVGWATSTSAPNWDCWVRCSASKLSALLLHTWNQHTFQHIYFQGISQVLEESSLSTIITKSTSVKCKAELCCLEKSNSALYKLIRLMKDTHFLLYEDKKLLKLLNKQWIDSWWDERLDGACRAETTVKFPLKLVRAGWAQGQELSTRITFPLVVRVVAGHGCSSEDMSGSNMFR